MVTVTAASLRGPVVTRKSISKSTGTAGSIVTGNVCTEFRRLVLDSRDYVDICIINIYQAKSRWLKGPWELGNKIYCRFEISQIEIVRVDNFMAIRKVNI